MSAGPILAVDIGAHGAAALLDEAGALLDIVDLPTLDAGPACRPEIAAPVRCDREAVEFITPRTRPR